MKDKCPTCSGSGVCPECTGTRKSEHVCKPASMTTIFKKRKWCNIRITYFQCSCGKYYKNEYERDPGAGDSDLWLELGQTVDYKTFTQEELDKVLSIQPKGEQHVGNCCKQGRYRICGTDNLNGWDIRANAELEQKEKVRMSMLRV